MMINRERIIDCFIRLININSPSFIEHNLSSFISGELRKCGFEVTLQDYGQSINLFALKTGPNRDAPILILNAHMDTVEDTEGIQYEIDTDMIRSIGPTVLGADDKSGIAQIIEAVRVVDELGIAYGGIEVLLTSAEERGLIGAKNLDLSLAKGRYALVLDSSGPVGNVIVGAPTHMTYVMTVTGRSAHAGIEPEQGINAIKVASEIIASMPDGRLDDITTANIGAINGGGLTNIVPKEAVIRGEIRSHNRDAIFKISEGIFDTAHKIANKMSAALDIKDTLEYESFLIDKDDVFLRLVAEAYGRCGIRPSFSLTGGGSDANVFNKGGIKAINISNGMQKVHTPEEFIMIDDLVRGAEIVVEVIKGMGGLKP